MINDTILRNEGMKILIEKFGNVEAERFITLMIREPFDYTKWHSKLFEGLSVKEISKMAMKKFNNNNT
jgi:Ran GTPase-activating protein (RanGAP) involved in mRNA processing and transport